MSPRKLSSHPPPRVRAIANPLATHLGEEVRAARIRRRWSLADLATRAGVSPSMIHGIEAGEPATLEGYARIAVALEIEPEFTFAARRSTAVVRDADPVHAAMGEVEAQQFGGHAFPVRLDEPYQHDQFAGRADLVAFAPGAVR
jgi:transcriptional regulator with XRE-family HTH domain